MKTRNRLLLLSALILVTIAAWRGLFPARGAISDPLLRQWREDSLGCMDSRSEALCRDIVAKYKLVGMNQFQLEVLLGRANYEGCDYAWMHELIYWYGTSCYNGVPNLNKRFCGVQFLFAHDQVVNIHYVCSNAPL